MMGSEASFLPVRKPLTAATSPQRDAISLNMSAIWAIWHIFCSVQLGLPAAPDERRAAGVGETLSQCSISGGPGFRWEGAAWQAGWERGWGVGRATGTLHWNAPPGLSPGLSEPAEPPPAIMWALSASRDPVPWCCHGEVPLKSAEEEQWRCSVSSCTGIMCSSCGCL